MMRGSRTVPPSTSGTPHRRQNTPKTASSAATRRSHHSASSSPPATAWPSIAAITGLRKVMRVGPIGPSPSSATRLMRAPPGSAIALRSAPAQKVPSAPVSTATASRVVGVEAGEGVDQRVGGRTVDRVASLGAVDGDDRDGTVDVVVHRHDPPSQ